MTGFPDDDIYEAACRLADLGCTVFPVDGKVPAIKWGRLRTKPPDEYQIRDWFFRNDYFGIGMILGDASQSICVRDFDDRESFSSWRSRYAVLAAELPTALTRRGGHVYFRSSMLSTTKLSNGEFRGINSYVVAPPSPHPSGGRYDWLLPLDRLPPFVDPVEAGLLPQPAVRGLSQRQNTTALGNRLIDVPLEVAVVSAIQATLPRCVGQRNDLVFEFARRLKAIPELHDRSGQEVLQYAHEWFVAALPTIRTKAWDITRHAFLSAWPRITHAFTDGTLTACLAEVVASLPSPIALQFLADPVTVRLVGLCERLQHITGSSPFFLSTESFGLFGLKYKMQLHRKLSTLIDAGVLERKSIGNRIQRKASTYCYLPTKGLHFNDEPHVMVSTTGIE